MRVIEIFHSVQGESTWAGLPTTFVRFARCNLRCQWCDTPYSFRGGDEMDRPAIHAAIDEAALGRVCLTGGEPLLQPELGDLASELLGRRIAVSVETGGHMDVSVLPTGVKRVVDLKSPATFGRAANASVDGPALLAQTEFLPANLQVLGPDDELKIVCADLAELPWVEACVRKLDLLARVGAVHLSPVHGAVDLAAVARWLVDRRLPLRLHLQQHKIVFGADARGV